MDGRNYLGRSIDAPRPMTKNVYQPARRSSSAGRDRDPATQKLQKRLALQRLGQDIQPAVQRLKVLQRCACPYRESVKLTALENVRQFNSQKLLGPIGIVLPKDAEANYYR